MPQKNKRNRSSFWQEGKLDITFLSLVLILLSVGLVMLFSASYASAHYENLPSTYYFMRQGIFAVAGIAIMFLISFMDYRIFRKFSLLLMIIGGSPAETAGGIKTSEFDPHTMEIRLVQGLYACGEVLDIDGDCGGYNLQWAWSSGAMAGGMHR